MKDMKIVAILICIICFIGCSNGDELNSIVLLQIDYVTYEFERGKELAVSAEIPDQDTTLPIVFEYQSPGDFGHLKLYYEPSGQMIFYGTIIWMGTGRIIYPVNFNSSDEFPILDRTIPQPDDTQFQIIFPPEDYSDSYSSIWNAIDDLEIVEDCMSNNKKIGLFLYTPSVGAGDPNEWDWFIVLYK